jgi:uncharacterized membrane protein
MAIWRGVTAPLFTSAKGGRIVPTKLRHLFLAYVGASLSLAYLACSILVDSPARRTAPKWCTPWPTCTKPSREIRQDYSSNVGIIIIIVVLVILVAAAATVYFVVLPARKSSKELGANAELSTPRT